MNSNTHSVRPSDGVAALTMAVQQLATQDLTGVTDAVRAERVLVLRRLVDMAGDAPTPATHPHLKAKDQEAARRLLWRWRASR